MPPAAVAKTVPQGTSIYIHTEYIPQQQVHPQLSPSTTESCRQQSLSDNSPPQTHKSLHSHHAAWNQQQWMHWTTSDKKTYIYGVPVHNNLRKQKPKRNNISKSKHGTEYVETWPPERERREPTVLQSYYSFKPMLWTITPSFSAAASVRRRWDHRFSQTLLRGNTPSHGSSTRPTLGDKQAKTNTLRRRPHHVFSSFILVYSRAHLPYKAVVFSCYSFYFLAQIVSHCTSYCVASL